MIAAILSLKQNQNTEINVRCIIILSSWEMKTSAERQQRELF